MQQAMQWLPLTEYSLKHSISISTLRRRIKSEDIQYRLEDGKYLILDDDPHSPPEIAQGDALSHRPSLKSDEQLKSESVALSTNNSVKETSESVLTAANRLLADLKKAYTQVLHEKENQIQSLKLEVNDLKTLIKVLEFENEKLRKYNSELQKF